MQLSTPRSFPLHGLGKMVAAAFHHCQVMTSLSDSRSQVSLLCAKGVTSYNTLAGGGYLLHALVRIATKSPKLHFCVTVLMSVCFHAASRLSQPRQQRQLRQVRHLFLPSTGTTAGPVAHLLTITCLHMQHHKQQQRRSKLGSKHVSAALASHQDVPTSSSSNGAGGGKPRVMVIGAPQVASRAWHMKLCPGYACASI